jgi:hypothetical protein
MLGEGCVARNNPITISKRKRFANGTGSSNAAAYTIAV